MEISHTSRSYLKNYLFIMRILPRWACSSVRPAASRRRDKGRWYGRDVCRAGGQLLQAAGSRQFDGGGYGRAAWLCAARLQEAGSAAESARADRRWWLHRPVIPAARQGGGCLAHYGERAEFA